ncbi:MAG: maleylpyruvate isomerase family mycothiol-dependent enzyme [Candidatus Dormibacteria bacterium]
MSVSATFPAELDLRPSINRIEREAARMAQLAETHALDARVPGCPGWDVEALVRHQGRVHRWAAKTVREQLQEWLQERFVGPEEPRAMVAWFREGAAQLIEALRTTPQSEAIYTFAPGPPGVAFWALRQANETSMHRWDVESAYGEQVAFEPAVAAELLTEWLRIAGGVVHNPAGTGGTIRFSATDADVDLTAALGERISSAPSDPAATAGLTLQGTASELYLVSMNRIDTSGLRTEGEMALLDDWRARVQF